MLKQLCKIIFLFCVPIMLSACLTMKSNVPRQYQLNSSSEEGLAAFSVTCSGDKGNVRTEIYEGLIQNFSKRNLLLNSGKTYSVEFSCNSLEEGMSRPELKVINLPAGNYFMLWWFLSTNANSVYFHVERGKLTYFGELHLKAGRDFVYTTTINNRASRDIPWIKRELLHVNNSDFKIRLGALPISRH